MRRLSRHPASRFSPRAAACPECAQREPRSRRPRSQFEFETHPSHVEPRCVSGERDARAFARHDMNLTRDSQQASGSRLTVQRRHQRDVDEPELSTRPTSATCTVPAVRAVQARRAARQGAVRGLGRGRGDGGARGGLPLGAEVPRAAQRARRRARAAGSRTARSTRRPASRRRGRRSTRRAGTRSPSTRSTAARRARSRSR